MQNLHTFSFITLLAKKLPGLLLLLICLPLQAQVTNYSAIDSLFHYGWQYLYSKPDSASWFFEKGKKESEQKNYHLGLIRYYNYDAALRIAKGQNEQALVNYEQAINHARKNNLNTELGLTYMKKGTLSQNMGDYGQAAEAYLAAAAILKTNEDRKYVIGLYNNINSTLNNLQLQNQSLQNVLPALKNNNTREKEIAALLTQKKTNEPLFDFPDQTTIRDITGGPMYVIFGGAKFHLASFDILNNYSNYRSVRKIPDGLLSRIPDIPRDGTILREINDPDGKVWLVKNKLRHQVQSPLVLDFFGGWDALCTVPENTLAQIPDAGDMVTLQNVLTTFNFKKEYEVLFDTLQATLRQNTWLLTELEKKLKAKNNALQQRKVLLWTFLVGSAALLCIGLLLLRNARQKQKLHRQSILSLKAEEELQKKMAIEKERTRIATDMHDDLGAGLSKIRFLSETVQQNMREEEHQPHLRNISSSSVELVDKFNEIIWAMNEKNNSLEDLLYYVRNYTARYCAENNLEFKTDIPENIPTLMISGEIRRHIFLTVKESLHNVVKHSEARQVWLDVALNDAITIMIRDNGKGFHPEGIKYTGNGLRNMKQRINNLNGRMVIQNNNGTIIKIFIPFPLSN